MLQQRNENAISLMMRVISREGTQDFREGERERENRVRIGDSHGQLQKSITIREDRQIHPQSADRLRSSAILQRAKFIFAAGMTLSADDAAAFANDAKLNPRCSRRRAILKNRRRVRLPEVGRDKNQRRFWSDATRRDVTYARFAAAVAVESARGRAAHAADRRKRSTEFSSE